MRASYTETFYFRSQSRDSFLRTRCAYEKYEALPRSFCKAASDAQLRARQRGDNVKMAIPHRIHMLFKRDIK